MVIVSESGSNPGVPLPHADLVAVLDEFAALDRYSRQREEVLKQLVDMIYACEIEFVSSERTYGYTPDERFRDGRTVIGSLAGSTHAVSIQMPASQNDEVESWGSGDVSVQAGRFVKWSSIYDRVELIAVPSVTLDDSGQQEATAEESVPEDSAAEVVSESVSEEDIAETVAEAAPAAVEEEMPEPPGETVVEEAVPVVEEEVAEQPVSAPGTAEQPASGSLPPVSAEDRNALLDATGPISSHQLIQFLAGALQFDPNQVTAIVDGLWDYILQPEHYQGRNRNWVLPHFGTFSLAYEAGQPSLGFRSRPREELRGQQANHWNHVASDRWIQFHQGQSDTTNVQGLSVKRRISVWVAEQTDVPLRTVHRVIWELMNIVRDIMAEGSRVIRWAMRGEMYRPGQDGNEEDTSVDCYVFRTYGRLRKRLPQQAVPATAKPAGLLSAITGLLKPKQRFKGPGVLRGPGALEGSETAAPSTWFNWKLWRVPWLFVIFLNFLPWNVSHGIDTSLREQILAATIALPLALSIIFHVMGLGLLTFIGQPTKSLFRWTVRFFIVISVVSGGVGFLVVLAQWAVFN
jgi:hypothetical protein